MVHKALSSFVSILAFAASSITASAGNANLVANPNFDTDVSGWLITSANAVWDANNNIAGGQNSGSLLVVSDPGQEVRIDQCIQAPLVAGTLYNFGTWIMLPTGQGANTLSDVYVGLWSASSCGNGAQLGAYGTNQVYQNNSWALSAGSVLAPAGVQSIKFQIRLYNYNGGASNVFENVDGVFFNDVILADGFEE